MIGPTGPISLFSEGLGQESIMRRLVIICILLAFMALSGWADGQTGPKDSQSLDSATLTMLQSEPKPTNAIIQASASETDFPVTPNNVQNNKVFNIVVIGDSIAWGAGLTKYEKYSYLVAKWIAEQSGRPVNVKVLAHTGANLKEWTDDLNIQYPDIPSSKPTLFEQADKISSPDDIDLLLVSGGANDVNLEKIGSLDSGWLINKFLGGSTLNEIQDKSWEKIESPMYELLKKLLNKSPNAKIVVTGYYSAISKDSKGLTEFYKAYKPISQFLDKYQNADDPKQLNELATKADTFYEKSNLALNSAKIRANRGSGQNRIEFARIVFPSDKSYGTDDSWLWRIEGTEGNYKTDDHKYDVRASLAGMVCQLIGRMPVCDDPTESKLAAVGHPNVEGAGEYNRTIVQKINEAWPDWLHPIVLEFEVSPTSVTSSETVKISYKVSSNCSEGLKQVELWRKDESSDWKQISINTLLGETNSVSGSFTDSPPAQGKYWYGVHVVDNAGNWNDERNSNTKNLPGTYGPIEVIVKEAEPTVNITILNSAGFRVDGAKVVIDSTSNNATDSRGELSIFLSDGNHTINASKPGYGIGNWSGYFNHTLASRINITLRPTPKHLFTITTINSAGFAIAGSEIKVDGIRKGHSGPDGNLSVELINGNHTIEANKSGYGSGNWTGNLDNRTNTVAKVKLNGALEYPFKIITVNSAGFPIGGTNVSIDGRYGDATNQQGELEVMLIEGSHDIEAKKTDYGSGNWTDVLNYNKSREVKVRLNGALEYPFNLTVLNAANYTIEGAKVSVGGIKKGVTDRRGYLKAMLTEGYQTIEAAKSGYGSSNFTGTLNYTQSNDIEIRINDALEYPFNITVLNSARNVIQGADVKADGKLIGLTDINGVLRSMLTEGNHTLKANKTGYTPGNWTGNLNHTETNEPTIELGGGSMLKDMQPIDLCLVLDTSGSMADQECNDLSKIQAVKEAAQDTIAGFFFPGSSNRVAVVSFSDVSNTNQEFTNNYYEAYSNVSSLSPGGATSFGLGLSRAVDEFRKMNQTNHVRTILFMSDGMHNTPPDYGYYLGLCRIMGIRVYTVGYGSEANHDLLKEMAQLSGGEYVFADPCGEQDLGIRYRFLLQQMGLSGSNPSINASGVVAQNQTVNATSFNVLPGSKYPTIEVIYPGSHLKVTLVGPDGKVADPKDYVYKDDPRVISVRLKDPRPGNWTVQVYGDQVNGTEPFTVYISPKYVAPTVPAISYKSIAIKETSGETLREYPIRISIDPKDFPSKANADGSDINIFDQNGRDLPRWIEKWDTKDKKAYVWVKVPQIPANGDVHLMMLTGNPGEPAANNGSNIFDFFDDFDGGRMDVNRWSVYNNSSSRVDESNGKLHISADARSFSSVGIFSHELFKPNITIRFLANVSEGQNLDRKGMGFLTDNVGENESQIKEGVYWRGQDKNLWAHHKFLSLQGSLFSSDYSRVEPKYDSGYKTWEIQWLDSLITYNLDDKKSELHKHTEKPKEAIGIGFSINTSVQAMPSDIFLDWILAYKCASSDPKVGIEPA